VLQAQHKPCPPLRCIFVSMMLPRLLRSTRSATQCFGLKHHHFFPRFPLFSSSFSSSKKTFYDILELSPSADACTVKAQYYKLSMLHHPDRLTGSEGRFLALSEAYATLGSSSRRREYDRLHGFNRVITHTSHVKRRRHATAASWPHARTPPRRPRDHGLRVVFDTRAHAEAHYGMGYRGERQEEEGRREGQTMGSIERVLQVTILLGAVLALTSIATTGNWQEQQRQQSQTIVLAKKEV